MDTAQRFSTGATLRLLPPQGTCAMAENVNSDEVEKAEKEGTLTHICKSEAENYRRAEYPGPEPNH